MKTAAAATVGMALGGSGVGFFLNSAQTYMELSRVMVTLNQRFATFEGNVTGVGRALGFARAEGGALMETLGAQTNTLNRGTAHQYMGFARTFGLDPSQTVGGLGRLQRLMGGHAPTRAAMHGLGAQAAGLGMGEGRFGEYMQVLSALGESEFKSTGRIGSNWAALGASSADFAGDMGLQGAMTTMALPGQVFGKDDPRSQGMEGLDFTQRLSGAFSGGGPWKSYMMRAMGYGRKGGPDYMTMRERLDAGVMGEMGSQNVKDIAKFMSAQGLGQGAIYRGLEGAFGGQLKAHELRALSGFIADENKVNAWAGGGALPDDPALQALANRAEWKGDGPIDFLETGRKAVPEGDVSRGSIEDLRVAVGEPLARTIIDLQGIMVNMAGSFENLTGFNPTDILDLIPKLTGAIEGLTEAFEATTRAGAEGKAVITSPSRYLSPDEFLVALRRELYGSTGGYVNGVPAEQVEAGQQ